MGVTKAELEKKLADLKTGEQALRNELVNSQIRIQQQSGAIQLTQMLLNELAEKEAKEKAAAELPAPSTEPKAE